MLYISSVCGTVISDIHWKIPWGIGVISSLHHALYITSVVRTSNLIPSTIVLVTSMASPKIL